MEARPKRILVADDQRDERSIQMAMLSHLGYSVGEAHDGEEALRMARESPPDLILMDIAMPRLDGVAACRALRSDPRTASIPVLLFTAATADDVEAKRAESGADGVLVKPVDPHDVATAIRRLIGPP